MITDDGVDDDSDTVSDNNDYNCMGDAHYTAKLLHIQPPWRVSSAGVKHYVSTHTSQPNMWLFDVSSYEAAAESEALTCYSVCHPHECVCVCVIRTECVSAFAF